MNLHFQIDPHSGVPVYRQVMDQVRYYVASGVLKGGDRLPSIRALSKSLSVNPATVVKAYGELAHAGVIELQHGRGVFVTGSTGKMSAGQKREAIRRLARQLAVEAAQLGADMDLVTDVLREEMEELGHE